MKFLLAAAVAAATLSFGSAHAANYTFDFAGPGLIADGSFATSNVANGDGSFDITSISGVADGLAITGLVAPTANDVSPDGIFDFDNKLFSGNPVFDINGVLFNTAAEEINIYANGASNYLDAKAAGGVLTDGGTPGTFVINGVSAVPEPSTWLLMIAGIGGIGLMLRRAKQTMGFRFRDAFSA